MEIPYFDRAIETAGYGDLTTQQTSRLDWLCHFPEPQALVAHGFWTVLPKR